MAEIRTLTTSACRLQEDQGGDLRTVMMENNFVTCPRISA